jgi:RNA polymerase sigma-70 factor (ECF subfamily)
MARRDQPSSFGQRRESGFQNTLWSRVIAAGSEGPDATQAAEQLCRVYWYPIYAFLRRGGHDRQQAGDLTQGFFCYLFEKSLFQKADPEKGRFRSFLLGTLKNFVHNEQERDEAMKRGGGAEIFSIDEETAEGFYRYEPATNLSPDKLFDRRWAMTVLQEATRRLETEYEKAGTKELYAKICPQLSGDKTDSHAELAGSLHKTEGATRVLIFRLRSRFRQLVRAVIADTVGDPKLVEVELQHLQAALRES